MTIIKWKYVSHYYYFYCDSKTSLKNKVLKYKLYVLIPHISNVINVQKTKRQLGGSMQYERMMLFFKMLKLYRIFCKLLWLSIYNKNAQTH